MKILGIETSCDETAVAVLEIKNGKIKVLSNAISSQIKLHAKFGGVVPSLAAREHTKNIGHVLKLALKNSKTKIEDIDLIAVTRGPGLGPALLVGISFAKTLAWKYDKPLIGTNHLEGHVYSNLLPPTGRPALKIPSPKQIFPALNLIVSGGHTELVLMQDYNKYKLVGETMDDAIGEAFDKVARLLGLGYPGGPKVSKMAEMGNLETYPLPSPMMKSKDLNFSYSGLKTAVLYLTRELGKLNDEQKADIAASFQKAATDVLLVKTMRAANEYKVKTIMLSGGVSANKMLREKLHAQTAKAGLKYSQPEMEYTGDNAAMIAIAGYFKYKTNKKDSSWESVEMDANLGF